MISRQQLEDWSKLYDLGHRNFSGWNSIDAENARLELDRQLRDAFQAESPNGSRQLFESFLREAKRKIVAFDRAEPWSKPKPP